jgi:D-arabinose 1-dehydrogenase
MDDIGLRPIAERPPTSIDDLPDIILGAGVFNYQYTDDPHGLAAQDVLRKAFDLGIRALDTSAYYGPSEEIVGAALHELRREYPRESYFICTKAGRVKEHLFDYDAGSIRKSVERSLARLHTDYLDVLYIHDVEFVDTSKCLEAINEAFLLKKEGVVRYVGISGYPLDFLLFLARKTLSLSHGPLDVVLSYSNFCLQNTRLAGYLDKFTSEAGVHRILNASPLSMSLLRSQPTHSFHPASPELRAAVSASAAYTAEQGVELAELASRFVFRRWAGSTVYGLSNAREVEHAVRDYWASKDKAWMKRDDQLVVGVQKILGSTLNQTWLSGIKHDDMEE